MALDLGNRAQLKSIIKEERRAFAQGENIAVPQKLDSKVSGMLSSLSGQDASIEEGELRDKLKGAMASGKKGSHFVHAGTVLKELDEWIAPMRPAPAAEEEEGEGEEAAE